MARIMAKKSAQSGNARSFPARTKTARRGIISRTTILGIGLALGGWIAGSMATMHGMAQSADGRLLASVSDAREVAPQDAPFSVIHLKKIAKYKRLAGASAIDKAERLEYAQLVHVTSQRPDAVDVREKLQAALKADEENRRIAALIDKRPEADAIRTALVAALGDTVAMAPKSTVDWNQPEEAGAQEVASLDTDTLKVMAEVEVEKTVAEAGVGALPQSGPVPVRRPQIAASVEVAKADIAEAPAKPARAAKPVVDQSADAEEDDAPKALAFARPDNPTKNIGRSIPWPDNGTKIAVYDITNGVVHMPNGEKLEAHSGIGEMRDNPKYTHVSMRGPTPPGSYKLSMREKLFHGVAAIRLTPLDGVAPKGRTGLLAHSYLLARRGDSHGCVAFADYSRFLKAFQRGDVTHMVIVERHNGRTPTLAVGRSTDRNVSGDKPQKNLLDYFRKDG